MYAPILSYPNGLKADLKKKKTKGKKKTYRESDEGANGKCHFSSLLSKDHITYVIEPDCWNEYESHLFSCRVVFAYSFRAQQTRRYYIHEL